MTFFVASGHPIEMAIISKERDMLIQPIAGAWGWAKGKKMNYPAINCFENCYRDAIEAIFNIKKITKRYNAIMEERLEKRRREEETERNLASLKKFRGIVEK